MAANTQAGRSVPRLVVVIAREWRKRSITSDFPKTKRDSVYMFSIFVVWKTTQYDLMCAKPILYERNKINNPGSSEFLPTYQATNKGFFIYECVRIPCQATNKGFFIYECVRLPHADDLCH